MAIILFDDNAHQTLLPLTFTRPVADLRIGILTIAEKWGKYLKTDFSYHTQPYLSSKFHIKVGPDNLFINGSVCPDEQLLEAVDKLKIGQALMSGDKLLAIKLSEADAAAFETGTKYDEVVNYEGSPVILTYPEDIFKKNDGELRKDFELLTKGRTSAPISNTNVIIGNDFFAEEGAIADCSTFSTLNGPIYLAAKTEVWEGTHIRGGFALHSHSHGNKVQL